VLKNLAKGLAVALVFFLAIEALLRIVYFARNATASYVPLPYSVGDEYGPTPPWLDGVRILERDSELIWKNRPGVERKYVDIFSPAANENERLRLLRQFIPGLPAALKNNPVWEISLNSQGFRDEEFPAGKTPGVFRIICLGDSWTFGANVGQEQAYPQRLKALLRREFPEANFEVFNLGVLGYSSQQGLELLRRTIDKMQPDMVTIAYAWNDASLAGFHDSDMSGHEISGAAKLAAAIAERSETFKLMRYLALLMKSRPKSLADRLREESARAREEAIDYDKLEPWTRVPLKDYEKNVSDMIELARRHGAGAVLLYNEMSEQSRYRSALKNISRARRVPLIDSSALVAQARREAEQGLESKLALQPRGENRAGAGGAVEVVFRVYAGDEPAAQAIYIAGNDPQLGDLAPNKVALYDDGTHGDQRAGDRVWSYSASFPRGTKLVYVYTNSGAAGRWEGLDVPAIRAFTVEAKGAAGKIYRPIESFGKLALQADAWHTNDQGYELIARALLDVLKQDQKMKDYLRR
jgi:lysophospholipase L1-like esterase